MGPVLRSFHFPTYNNPVCVVDPMPMVALIPMFNSKPMMDRLHMVDPYSIRFPLSFQLSLIQFQLDIEQ